MINNLKFFIFIKFLVFITKTNSLEQLLLYRDHRGYFSMSTNDDNKKTYYILKKVDDDYYNSSSDSMINTHNENNMEKISKKPKLLSQQSRNIKNKSLNNKPKPSIFLIDVDRMNKEDAKEFIKDNVDIDKIFTEKIKKINKSKHNYNHNIDNDNISNDSFSTDDTTKYLESLNTKQSDRNEFLKTLLPGDYDESLKKYKNNNYYNSSNDKVLPSSTVSLSNFSDSGNFSHSDSKNSGNSSRNINTDNSSIISNNDTNLSIISHNTTRSIKKPFTKMKDVSIQTNTNNLKKSPKVIFISDLYTNLSKTIEYCTCGSKNTTTNTIDNNLTNINTNNENNLQSTSKESSYTPLNNNCNSICDKVLEISEEIENDILKIANFINSNLNNDNNNLLNNDFEYLSKLEQDGTSSRFIKKREKKLN